MINFLLGLCVGVMLTFLTLFIAAWLAEPSIDDPVNSAGPPPSVGNAPRRYQLGKPGNRYDI